MELLLDYSRCQPHEQMGSLLRHLFSALGHELPNQLVAIQGMACMAEEEVARFPAEQTEEARFFLSRIARQARSCDGLVRELAELGKLILDEVASWVLLSEVANEAAARIQVQFPHRNLTISVPENLPRVLVSRRVLYRVFWELMKNAVQVAQEPVEIRVGGERSFDKLRFWVADNGPGITVPHPEKLFEPFARSDPQASSAQAPPGFPERLRGSEVEESFGLGLFLVSQVVARWQGSLHLASAPGQGATFTVSLPQPSGEEG